MVTCTTRSRSLPAAVPSCASNTNCRITVSSTKSASSPPGRCPTPLSSATCRWVFRSARTSGTRRALRICAAAGAQLLLVPNGSPFEVEKFHQRLDLARSRVSESGLPLAYVNQVGGQDELVFDGGSFVMNADGSLAHLLPFWREALLVSPLELPLTALLRARVGPGGRRNRGSPPIYSAMVLGLRDYVQQEPLSRRRPRTVRRNRFCADGGGRRGCAGRGPRPRRPSAVPLHQPASQDDALETATLLGMRLETVPIEAPVNALESVLEPLFAGRPRDITEENLQARVRGVLLMALSNKFGELLVTTGNKSEMSVGYATLYGDMCGGYSVLKDIYKTEVYALARWRNDHVPEGGLGPAGRVIPGVVSDQSADRGAAAEPDRPGHAAAVRRARRHPARLSSRTSRASMRSWRAGSRATSSHASSTCSIPPSTSGDRRRRALRSRARASDATGGIR